MREGYESKKRKPPFSPQRKNPLHAPLSPPPLKLRIARTPAQKALGYSFVLREEENAGILFINDPPEKIRLWMRNVSFPLSAACLDENGKIVKIFRDMRPYTTDIYSSGCRVKYVIEVPHVRGRDWFDVYGVEEGDTMMVLGCQTEERGKDAFAFFRTKLAQSSSDYCAWAVVGGRVQINDDGHVLHAKWLADEYRMVGEEFDKVLRGVYRVFPDELYIEVYYTCPDSEEEWQKYKEKIRLAAIRHSRLPRNIPVDWGFRDFRPEAPSKGMTPHEILVLYHGARKTLFKKHSCRTLFSRREVGGAWKKTGERKFLWAVVDGRLLLAPNKYSTHDEWLGSLGIFGQDFDNSLRGRVTSRGNTITISLYFSSRRAEQKYHAYKDKIEKSLKTHFGAERVIWKFMEMTVLASSLTLYHATFGQLLPKIKEQGLRAGSYLSPDPKVALEHLKKKYDVWRGEARWHMKKEEAEKRFVDLDPSLPLRPVFLRVQTSPEKVRRINQYYRSVEVITPDEIRVVGAYESSIIGRKTLFIKQGRRPLLSKAAASPRPRAGNRVLCPLEAKQLPLVECMRCPYNEGMGGQEAICMYDAPTDPNVLIRRGSILDLPRETLPPQIWNLEQDPPALRPEVAQEIKGRLEEWLTQKKYGSDWIASLYYIGSTAGYQYQDDSDIDITIVPDLSKFREQVEDVKLFVRSMVKELNGWELFGHPVNYYVRPDATVPLGEAIYDIDNNVWIKSPNKIPRDWFPEDEYGDAMMEAEGILTQIDAYIGQLSRRAEDYSILLDFLEDKDVSESVRKRLQKKADTMKQLVVLLGEEYNLLHEQRKKEFGKGRQNKGRGNIIYKYLEKYGYLDLLKDMKKMQDDITLYEIKEALRRFFTTRSKDV